MKMKLVFLIAMVIIFSTFNLKGEGKALNLQERIQEHSNWCWAASSQAVLYYYNSYPSQCQIANFAWSRSDCCGSSVFSWNHICNVGNELFNHNGDVEDVLNHWGVAGKGIYDPLAWHSLKIQIIINRPFIMAFYWTGGGGHALVGYGYKVISGINYIKYMDPWPGEGFTTSTYNWALSSSNHYWGRTLQTSH